MKTLLLLALSLLLPMTSRLRAQSVKDAPEMKVLLQFVGKWKFEATQFKAEWTPEEKHLTGTATSAAVLDGSFIEEKAILSDHTTAQKLYTYDRQAGTYRAWWFSSLGHFNDSTGTWDAASRTFTWITKLPTGQVGKTTQHFPDDQTMEWEIAFTGDDRTLYFRSSGKNTRE